MSQTLLWSGAWAELPGLKGIGPAWGLALIIGIFLASVAIAGTLVVRLPPTYFLDGHPREGGVYRHFVLRWIVRVLKNVLGALLIVAGTLMVFTPGQGVLTILIGLLLLDLPGKRTMERKLVSRPRVQEALNRLRARFGRPPLVLEQRQEETGRSVVP